MTCWNCGEEPAVTADGLGEECDKLPMRPSQPIPIGPMLSPDDLFEGMLRDVVKIHIERGGTFNIEEDDERVR